MPFFTFSTWTIYWFSLWILILIRLIFKNHENCKIKTLHTNVCSFFCSVSHDWSNNSKWSSIIGNYLKGYHDGYLVFMQDHRIFLTKKIQLMYVCVFFSLEIKSLYMTIYIDTLLLDNHKNWISCAVVSNVRQNVFALMFVLCQRIYKNFTFPCGNWYFYWNFIRLPYTIILIFFFFIKVINTI